MTDANQQLASFDRPEPEPSTPLDRARAAQRPARLNAHTSLSNAVGAYHDHLENGDFSPHTVKSFIYDLNILIEFAGPTRPIGQLAQRDLEDFMNWLVNGRGVPCNAKSLARRLTTLKAFFRWLTEIGALSADPAAPIAHKPVSTPLPDILTDEQVEQVLAAASQLRHNAQKPDARPYILVTLLLKTGIKKNECAAITLEHLDLSDPEAPSLWIRYQDPRYHHKERKLKLEPRWVRVLPEYRAQYKIEHTLFPCTPRTLEYVLADVGQLANLPRQLSS